MQNSLKNQEFLKKIYMYAKFTHFHEASVIQKWSIHFTIYTTNCTAYSQQEIIWTYRVCPKSV